MSRALITLLACVISGCGSAVYVADYAIGRAGAENKGISSQDYENLRAGQLLAVVARYESLAPQQRTHEQTALLCDIYLKLQDFPKAATCNSVLADFAIKQQDAVLLARVQGRLAQINLAKHQYQETLEELAFRDEDGAVYLRGIANARLGQAAEAQLIAKRLAKQFKPKPVFYAAALYAATGDCVSTLHLLKEPERRLLADYGLVMANDGAQISATLAPFRLDPFDDFTFGTFTDHSYAPAANVYVELLAAQCLRQTGNSNEAEQRLKKLLAFPNLPAYRDAHWVVLHELAQLARTTGHHQDVIPYLRQAAAVIEQGRAAIGTENGRFAFIADKQQVYAELVNELRSAGKIEESLEFVERSKSRGLVDLLASRKDFTPGDVPKTEVDYLLNNLGAAEESITLVAVRGGGVVDKAVAELRAATDQIIGKSPNLAHLVTVVPRTFADIAQTLRADETAIVYYEAEGNWLAFVVNAGTVNVVTLGSHQIKDLVTKFREAALHQETNQYLPPLQELSTLLLQPVLPSVKTQRIIIVPHGPLHYLPFAALLDANVPLIRTKLLRIVPSLAVLSNTAKTKELSTNGLIFGNPDRGDPKYDLPGAELEATEVQHIFPGSKLYMRQDATIAHLQAEVQGKAFLHIAAHGVFDSKQPLSSRLLFAVNASTHNDLTAADLYGMRLDTPLAVLSACESGLNEITSGEDLIGLIRGFLFAGVKTVIGSYWQVDDEATKHMMIELYKGLHAGKSVSAAMQTAQISTMEKFPHPFFWAAFTVIGDDSRLTSNAAATDI